MEADLAAFRAREAAPAASGPHLRVALPYPLLDRLVAPRVAALAPVDLGAGRRVRVRGVRFVPARSGRAGVTATLAFEEGADLIFALELTAEVAPVVDVEKGRVALALGGDDLRALRPTLGPVAREALGAFVRGQLPARVRPFVGRAQVGALAGELAETLLEAGWPLVRDHLLVHLPALARVELELPDLPLRRLDVTSTARGLEVGATTTLPGARPAPTPDARNDTLTASLHGSTVAELGNLAIERGLVPDRYDAEGNAKPDGAWRARLGWGDGERPARLLMWRNEGQCLRATLAATPRMTLTGDTVAVRLSDGEVESVEGPVLVQLGAWWENLGRESFDRTLGLARSVELQVAGQPLRLTLAGARFASGALHLELTAPAP